MFFLSSECFPSVQRLLSSVNRSSLFQHWLRFVSSLYPSVFPPSNTCCPPSNICSAPSKGLRSIKRASLHQKGFPPSKWLLSVLRAIKRAALRFLCYPSGFSPSKGLRSVLRAIQGLRSVSFVIRVASAPSKGLRSVLRAIQLASLRFLCYPSGFPPSKGLRSVLRAIQGLRSVSFVIRVASLHQKGCAPFLGLSNWLRSIKRASLLCHWLRSVLRALQLASLRFLCYPSGFRSFAIGSAPFLGPFKGCAPFPLLSEWLLPIKYKC